jgi:hypothetical protein
MAYCPKCKAEMDSHDIACPACGYDFPQAENPKAPKEGLLYSQAANIILVIAAVLCIIGSFFSIIITCINLIQFEIENLFACLAATILLLALTIVFVRALSMNENQ